MIEWEEMSAKDRAMFLNDSEACLTIALEKALSRYIYELGQAGQPMNVRLPDLLNRLSEIASTGIAPQPEAVDDLELARQRGFEQGVKMYDEDRANKVSVELTREELDRLEVAWVEFNQPFAEYEWEPIDDRIAAKLRSALGEGETPGPYARVFAERVCPVPEFPGIEKEDGDVWSREDHFTPPADGIEKEES